MCALAVLAICASACNLDNPGFTAPRGRITYAISLALSTDTTESGAPRYLYVANSNFDLRYSGGLPAYDLEELQRSLEQYDCREAPQPEPEVDASADPDAGAEPDAGDEL